MDDGRHFEKSKTITISQQLFDQPP